MLSISISKASKSYGKFRALSDVSLALKGGEVHALMGENGAGKSTLIKMLAGVISGDSLAVKVDGQALSLTSPAESTAGGFRFIHQELNVVPELSVAENILLSGRYPRRLGFLVDWKSLQAQAQAALRTLGIDHIDVTRLLAGLNAGDRMLVKIAAALVNEPGENALMYVFDEPTAALTERESDKLFQVIRQLKAQGASILYVSHRMNEVMSLCDTVTVLRDGQVAYTGRIEDTHKAGLIYAMTGRELSDTYPARKSAHGTQARCQLQALNTSSLTGISCTISEGEILGITGLAGAGQSELLQVFMGMERCNSGAACLEDKPVPRSPAEAWSRGVAYIPRERRSQALMLARSVRDNTLLPHLSSYGFFANRRQETRHSTQLAGLVKVKASHQSQAVQELSGGNQQKVVFARALGGHPKLLLLDEPTRGVDVGSKFDIYQLIRQLSEAGCSVMLSSTDLPELVGLCDRILVLREGRQIALLNTDGLTTAQLLSRFQQVSKV